MQTRAQKGLRGLAGRSLTRPGRTWSRGGTRPRASLARAGLLLDVGGGKRACLAAERQEAHLAAGRLPCALEGPFHACLQRAGLTLQEGAAALHTEHLPFQQCGVGRVWGGQGIVRFTQGRMGRLQRPRSGGQLGHSPPEHSVLGSPFFTSCRRNRLGEGGHIVFP